MNHELTQKEILAFNKRKTGATYASIAQDLGVTAGRARQLCVRAEHKNWRRGKTISLLTPIENVEWESPCSLAIQNALSERGLEIVADIVKLPHADVLKLRNMGRKRLSVIIQTLNKHGIRWGWKGEKDIVERKLDAVNNLFRLADGVVSLIGGSGVGDPIPAGVPCIVDLMRIALCDIREKPES